MAKMVTEDQCAGRRHRCFKWTRVIIAVVIVIVGLVVAVGYRHADSEETKREAIAERLRLQETTAAEMVTRQSGMAEDITELKGTTSQILDEVRKR